MEGAAVRVVTVGGAPDAITTEEPDHTAGYRRDFLVGEVGVRAKRGLSKYQLHRLQAAQIGSVRGYDVTLEGRARVAGVGQHRGGVRAVAEGLGPAKRVDGAGAAGRARLVFEPAGGTLAA